MELMEVRVDSNKIQRLLKMRGEERLRVKDDITAGIHSVITNLQGKSCVRLAFLESIKRESWVEYSLLLEIPKCDDHVKYLSEEFKQLGDFLKELETVLDYNNSGINSLGIDQVETGLPDSYYILLYILRDDK